MISRCRFKIEVQNFTQSKGIMPDPLNHIRVSSNPLVLQYKCFDMSFLVGGGTITHQFLYSCSSNSTVTNMSENVINPSVMLERKTCLGKPFNLERCDAEIRPHQKTRDNTSKILSKLPRHFNNDLPYDSHLDANLKELKKCATSYTCEKHRRYMEHFAYSWLASHSLSHFLKCMSWS